MSGCGEKCGCENLTTYEPCGENLTCCEHCPDGAPCAYAIISKCRWKKNGLFLNGITPLWKECLFECKWTARRCIDHDADCLDLLGNPLLHSVSGGDAPNLLGCGSEGGPPTASPLGDLFPPAGGAETDHGDSVVQVSPPVALDGTDYVATRLKFGCGRMPNNPSAIPGYPDGECADPTMFGEVFCPPPYRCGWFDWYGRDTACGVDVEAWLNTCTAIAWELIVTGTDTATLTAWESAGDDATVEVVATYNCNNWQCIPEFAAEDKSSHGNTFVMDGDAAVGFEAYLPRKLCVVPFSSDWQTPCSSKSAACACYDPGADSSCLDVDLGTCGGLQEDVVITRNATLPSGVTEPSPAPCGWFWGDLGTICTGVQFGVLTYCDGTDYHVDLWCNHDGGGWNEIDTAIATLTDTCPGAAYTWEWSGDWGDCCCVDTVETPCCESDGIPGTLYATITATGCEIDGDVVTINYTGLSAGLHTWSGTFSASCGTATLNVTIIEGTCRMSFELKIGSSTCTSGTGSGVPVPCPFTSETVTGTWLNPPCGCCANGTGISIVVSA